MSLQKGGRERFDTEEGSVTTGADFKDGGRSHEPRDSRNAALEARKGQEMNSPLEPLEGHLDFSPVTLISDF